MRKIFIITIFLFLFSTFANAQAVMSYLYLKVVDSNQKPIADATVEVPPDYIRSGDKKTTDEKGGVRFGLWTRQPDSSEFFRIIKPDHYPFELFGLFKRVFYREDSGYRHNPSKFELLKIPKNNDEQKALGDEQIKRDFFLAVLNGKSTEVRRMLKSEINPNISTDDLRGVPAPKEIPAMLYAANNADIAVMNEFLSAKIDLKRENSNIRNLLAYYINGLPPYNSEKEYSSVFNDYFETLLKAGASLNATDSRGKTLLMIAAQKDELEIVKKLIEKGVDINAKTEYGSTALTELVDLTYSKPNAQRFKVFELLLKSGADPNIIRNKYNSDCEFPLKTLTSRGLFDLAKLFLSYKANPKLKCENGRNALSDLFSNKGDSEYPEVANILIDAGLDVNTVGENGRTPLMTAAGSGNISIVKRLLNKGAKVNAQNGWGYTPLMSLIYSLTTEVSPEDKDIAELLLKSGADPNLVTRSEFSYDKTARALAVCRIRTPPDKNLESVSDQIIELLLSYKAISNITSKYGESLLIWAVKLGRVEATKMLLKAGADIYATGDFGRTVLATAVHYQETYRSRTEYQEIIKLLEAAGAK